MKYLALDIETGGLTTDCSVLEVALVQADTEDISTRVEDLPFMAQLFRPDPIVISPMALRMHANNGLLDLALERGDPVDDAWWCIEEYLDIYAEENGIVVGEIVVAGKNVAGFDLKFFPEHIRKMIHYRTIDVGSLYLRLGNDAPPSLKDILLKTMGRNLDANHRALGDARDTVRAIQWVSSYRV